MGIIPKPKISNLVANNSQLPFILSINTDIKIRPTA